MEKKGFRSSFGFLMAAVGSAVGLGNIWGFPQKLGRMGGFTFLAVYLFLAVFCGLIVMVSELALGRRTGKGPIAAYRSVSKRFWWAGWLATLAPLLILFFYSALGGYCIKYMVMNIGNLLGAGFGTRGQDAGIIFTSFMERPGEAIVYCLIFVAITMLIVMGGISDGIEKMCAVGMPALFVMLLLCIIKAWTLPNAMEGLKFMFIPGYGLKLGIITEMPSIFTVLTTAGGQMFFSLSLAIGAMIVYGSYMKKEDNIARSAGMIVVFDTLVALLAGLCVIPSAVSYGLAQVEAGVLEDASQITIGGPKLLYIAMQNVFDGMGAVGSVFGILFYLLVTLAAVSTSISLLEVVVVYFTDKASENGHGDTRKKYTLLAAGVVALGSILVAADGLGSNGLWVPFQHLVIGNWNDCWLDFIDMLSEGLMMPIGALAMTLMIGHEIGPDSVREEIESSGHRFRSYKLYSICIRFITPILLLIVLYGQIHDFFL